MFICLYTNVYTTLASCYDIRTSETENKKKGETKHYVFM